MASTSISVLSCDGIDSCASISLSSDSENFLFDCGEGTQRLCVEKKFRLSKLSRIFLTRLEPENTGGIPGLILTTVDSGRKQMALQGPAPIHSYWGTIQHFCQRPNLQMQIDEISVTQTHDQAPIYYGDSVTVESVISNTLPTHVSYICQSRQLPGKFNISKATALGVPKGPLFAQLKSGNPITLPSGTVVTPNDVLEAADPPGFVAIVCSLQRLDATLIKEHLHHPAWSRFQMENSCGTTKSMQCMFHLSPRVVVESAEYVEWIQSFGTGAKHVFCGSGFESSNSRSPFVAATLANYKLHTVCPALFTDVYSSQEWFNPHRTQKEENKNDEVVETETSSDTTVRVASPSLQYRLLPMSQRGLSSTQLGLAKVHDKLTDFHDLLASDSILSSPGVWREDSNEGADVDKGVSSDIEDKRNDTHEKSAVAFGDNRLLFLGTGCAVPSKYRNVSGIALRLASFCNDSTTTVTATATATATTSAGAHARAPAIVLLDVGEGSWFQLMRIACNDPSVFMNGKMSSSTFEQVQCEVARELAVAWVSHPHADHHLGLVTLITTRHRILTEMQSNGSNSYHQHPEQSFEPLLVIAPVSVLFFLRSYATHVLPCLKTMYTGVACNFFDPDEDYLTQAPDNSLGNSDSSLSDTEETSHSYRDVYAALMQESLKNLHNAKEKLESLGISTFENVNVVHCNQSYGLAITLQIPDSSDHPTVISSVSEPNMKKCKVSDNATDKPLTFKLVYSGDTRPSPRLVQLGFNASLLIHEATFDDLKQDEALKKRHSTISEALQVARDMNAYRTILTHFSQRYPNIPPMPADASLSTPVFASDFMNVSFRDLLWAHKATAAMARIFPADEEDDDDEIKDGTAQDEPSLKLPSEQKTKSKVIKEKSTRQEGSAGVFIPTLKSKVNKFLPVCECALTEGCNHLTVNQDDMKRF